MATEEMAQRGAASMANTMVLMCVADSRLGKFREGQCPVTGTGDYSDVVVVDADGRIVPWQGVARRDANEMGRTMREIVDKLYTCLLNMEDAALAALRDHGAGSPIFPWRPSPARCRWRHSAAISASSLSISPCMGQG